MRTRLDEIVDQELKKWNGFVWSVVPWPTVARDVAERAFRHGVERGSAATDVIGGHTFNFNDIGWMDAMKMGVDAARKQMANVQPAPAAEKDVVPAPHCPIRCGGPHSRRRDGMFHCNNRKGERRKGTEDRACVLPPLDGKDVSPIYQFNSRMFWLRDRRTGKDRRRG